MERERSKGRLLPHLLPVGREPEHIPVPGGREVEFPIALRSLFPEKSFQAGFLPEAVPPSRQLSRCGNREFRQIAEERVAEEQGVRTPPDRPRDLPGSPVFLSPERLHGKALKI